MDENSNIPNQPDWEKLLDFLAQENQDESLLNAEERKQLQELKRLIQDAGVVLSPYSQFKPEEKWESLKLRLSGLEPSLQEEPKDLKIPKVNKRYTWKRVLAVAAAICLVTMAVLFYYSDVILNSFQDPAVAKHDIAPGKIGATLTLANGKQIRLSEVNQGQLAEEAGVAISKTADGQIVYEVKENKAAINPKAFNTLTTAKGEKYQVKLPDGTIVWLNAASSLTYPAGLYDGGQRRVKLQGEGYFAVSRDEKRPFVIESHRQVVEVLGTAFNVSAYQDENSVKTTLISGSVKITIEGDATGQAKTYLLKPNQQANLSGSQMHIEGVEPSYAIAWKDGYFMFGSERLETAMHKISRWYNLEIDYDDPSLKDETIFGTISQFENVSKVIALLEKTKVLKFNLKGNTLLIMRQTKK